VTATSVDFGGGDAAVAEDGGGAGSGAVGASAGADSTGRLGGRVACSCRGDEWAVGGVRVGAWESSSADSRGEAAWVGGASDAIVVVAVVEVEKTRLSLLQGSVSWLGGGGSGGN
jgi:hypothetical protein